MPLHPSTKSEWRRYLITQRSQLTADQKSQAASCIISCLLQQSFWQQANKIAMFAATNAEVNLLALHEIAWSQHKHLYLPIIEDEQLLFGLYTPETPLQKNQYAILEPLCSAKDRIAASNLDLILLPAVGIDQQGVRLGMGKGYYDKSLPANKAHGTPPLLISTIFDNQLVEKLPHTETDVLVDGVITEKQLRLY